MRLTDFLDEFSRRRVGRVAIAYAIVAWALVQVADLVLPRLAFPDWTVTLLILIAIAGFPVALALAWFYDVVPDSASSGDRARRRRGIAAAGAVGVVVLLAAAGAVRTWTGLTGPNARIGSIAVLPFDNLSADAEQEYFAAGMHDALITELAQIASVRVVSRKSTLRFAEGPESIGDIARELGVDAVVEGSVLKVGNDLRMQVQLIRALPTERHVWAESYERQVGQAQRLNGQIARTIAREIRVRLTPEEEARLTHTREVDPRAYESYLRGMFLVSRQTPEDYARGLQHLQQAVDQDPSDPYAWAGLALGYSVIGHGTIPDAFERAKAAAARALAIDSTVAAAHEAVAEIALYRDWDYDRAEGAFRQALSLKPNLPEGSAHYAWLLQLRGRDDEALDWMRRATSLDPLNPLWTAWLGWIHLNTQQWDSALVNARAALELGDHPHAMFVAGVAAAMLGDYDYAMSMAQRLDAIPPFRWGGALIQARLGHHDAARAIADAIAERPTPMNAFGIALIHAELGNGDDAIRWLERAEAQRFSWMPWIARDVNLRGLRADPRFQAMLVRLGLREPPLDLQA